jgi:predicted transcriptional regulator of viral defense system
MDEPQVTFGWRRQLRRKGWLERATWDSYLLIPPEFGPDALGNSNLLAHASHIAEHYYIGFGSAAAHYGLTTQHRNVIYVVTPKRLREREIGDSRVEIVTQSERKFFGFEPIDVLGHEVSMSDREKTAIDCVDHSRIRGRGRRGCVRLCRGFSPSLQLGKSSRLPGTNRRRRSSKKIWLACRFH